MSLLAASVPEGEFPRSEIVAVRLARKVAPLFGVPWEHNPLRRTWVCDFVALTLAEVSRGAPGSQGEDGLPGAAAAQPMASATVNRFGPDTKAAVVLTGANRLLVDVTAAVREVCAELSAQPLDPKVRLAIWAGLVLEVFRSQPALIAAAVQARSVQRSVTARWGDHVVAAGLAGTAARCEVGASRAAALAESESPVRFQLIDDTLQALELDHLDPAADGPRHISPERREDIASTWCRRVLRLGRPGAGIVWLTEETPGHRRVRSYQRLSAMVAPFVAEVLGPDEPKSEALLPKWPHDSTLAQCAPLAARCHALAVHSAVSYLRFLERPARHAPRLKPDSAALVHRAAAATVRRLGAEDPAALMLTGYDEYLGLLDLVRAPAGDPGADAERAVADVLAGARRTARAWRRGELDPGTASYLLEIGAIAVGRAVLDGPDGGSDGGSAAVRAALARTWRETMESRGLPPDPVSALAELTPPQLFHLQRYADYLSARGGIPDLRKAMAVYESISVVRDEVARHEPTGLAVMHTAARLSHEGACDAAERILAATPPRERTARARLLEAAERHLHAFLANPSTVSVLAQPGQDRTLSWAVQKIGPALARLLEDAPGRLSAVERHIADQLISAAAQQKKPPSCVAQLALLLAAQPLP